MQRVIALLFSVRMENCLQFSSKKQRNSKKRNNVNQESFNSMKNYLGNASSWGGVEAKIHSISLDDFSYIHPKMIIDHNHSSYFCAYR